MEISKEAQAELEKIKRGLKSFLTGLTELSEALYPEDNVPESRRIACPRCGGLDFMCICITTYPPTYETRCSSCGEVIKF